MVSLTRKQVGSRNSTRGMEYRNKFWLILGLVVAVIAIGILVLYPYLRGPVSAGQAIGTLEEYSAQLIASSPAAVGTGGGIITLKFPSGLTYSAQVLPSSNTQATVKFLDVNGRAISEQVITAGNSLDLDVNTDGLKELRIEHVFDSVSRETIKFYSLTLILLKASEPIFAEPVTGPDVDSDSVPDSIDNCPAVKNTNQKNRDSDGKGDACEIAYNDDLDGDGIMNFMDNCVYDPNPFFFNPSAGSDAAPDQDRDGRGDVCDSDVNGDGKLELTRDSNGDGTNDKSFDTDSDTVLDDYDNCPTTKNGPYFTVKNIASGPVAATFTCTATQPTLCATVQGNTLSAANQADADGDGVGDICDLAPTDSLVGVAGADNDGDNIIDTQDNDDDNDTVLDAVDNCPLTANKNQADADADKVGDVCDGYQGDNFAGIIGAVCTRDTDCTGSFVCKNGFCAGVEVLCNNLFDDDSDGLVDCADEDCTNNLACGDEICTDNFDNDQNGLIDCKDNRCIGQSCGAGCLCESLGVKKETTCKDTLDNDNDGAKNCDDSDCKDDTYCATVGSACAATGTCCSIGVYCLNIKANYCGNGIKETGEMCDPPQNYVDLNNDGAIDVCSPNPAVKQVCGADCKSTVCQVSDSFTGEEVSAPTVLIGDFDSNGCVGQQDVAKFVQMIKVYPAKEFTQCAVPLTGAAGADVDGSSCVGWQDVVTFVKILNMQNPVAFVECG